MNEKSENFAAGKPLLLIVDDDPLIVDTLSFAIRASIACNCSGNYAARRNWP